MPDPKEEVLGKGEFVCKVCWRKYIAESFRYSIKKESYYDGVTWHTDEWFIVCSECFGHMTGFIDTCAEEIISRLTKATVRAVALSECIGNPLILLRWVLTRRQEVFSKLLQEIKGLEKEVLGDKARENQDDHSVDQEGSKAKEADAYSEEEAEDQEEGGEDCEKPNS